MLSHRPNLAIVLDLLTMSENRQRKTKLRNTLGPCPRDDGVRVSIVFHSGKSEWSFRGLLEPGSG